MIKRFEVKAAVIGGTMLAALSSGVAYADLRDFRFVNMHYSEAIIGAWIAAAGTSEPWRPITLYSPIEPQSIRPIAITAGSGCIYDLKVRFSDGHEQLGRFDLCTTYSVVAS